MKKDYHLFIAPSLIVVLADQISKWLVLNILKPHQIYPVIHGFFNLVMVKNRGMAFGIFSQSRSGFPFYFLLAATILAIGVIIFFFFWTKGHQKWLTVGLSLILGGAAGNLIDRVRFGYVIDFLDFFFKSYHWPSFNIADSAITIGTFWLMLNIIIRNKFGEDSR